jgi:hypothetical protein
LIFQDCFWQKGGAAQGEEGGPDHRQDHRPWEGTEGGGGEW